MCSGHGENIIDNMIAQNATYKLKSKGFIDAKTFVNKISAFEYDLGMITTVFNSATNKLEVGIYQTCEAFHIGYISSIKKKPTVNYIHHKL